MILIDSDGHFPEGLNKGFCVCVCVCVAVGLDSALLRPFKVLIARGINIDVAIGVALISPLEFRHMVISCESYSLTSPTYVSAI